MIVFHNSGVYLSTMVFTHKRNIINRHSEQSLCADSTLYFLGHVRRL